MANGTIKKIVSERGFGFIAGSDGEEYFFHRDGVDNFDSLRGGGPRRAVRSIPCTSSSPGWSCPRMPHDTSSEGKGDRATTVTASSTRIR